MNSGGNYICMMGSLIKQKVLSFLPQRNEISALTEDDLVYFFSFCLIKVSHIVHFNTYIPNTFFFFLTFILVGECP